MSPDGSLCFGRCQGSCLRDGGVGGDGWQVYQQLASLAVFLSEPATLIEREPEYLFNAVWAFAQEFDRAYLHIIKCAGQADP